MRNSVIDKIKGLALSGLNITSEQPFDEAGTPVYIKNPKTIYVDNLNIDYDTLYSTLGGTSFSNEVNIVRIYFVTDAKNHIANYDSLVSQLKSIKETIELPGAHRRDCSVQTSYVNDKLVTELEYRLTKLS